MSNISIKGVLIGAITFALTAWCIGFLGLVFDVIAQHIMHIPREILRGYGLPFLPMSLAGFACSMLGGYVAALIAKRHELLNGGLSSFYFVLTTLFQMTRGHNYYPLLVQVLLLIAGSASAVLGGYLRSRRRAIQYAPQTDSELIRK